MRLCLIRLLVEAFYANRTRLEISTCSIKLLKVIITFSNLRKLCFIGFESYLGINTQLFKAVYLFLYLQIKFQKSVICSFSMRIVFIILYSRFWRLFSIKSRKKVNMIVFIKVLLIRCHLNSVIGRAFFFKFITFRCHVVIGKFNRRVNVLEIVTEFCSIILVYARECFKMDFTYVFICAVLSFYYSPNK